MNHNNNFIQKKKSDKEGPANLSGKSESKNKAIHLADNRPSSLVQKVTLTNKAGAHSFQMPNKSTADKTGPVVQKVDIGPHYCQHNNEWYAVDMNNTCFQHFLPDQHQAVINACTATLAAHANQDWTTFNQTGLQHNGWNFICTWVENHQHRYLNVYHADHGYKDHSGKKEDKREQDKKDRFKREPPKDVFGKKDPSAMSSEEMANLLGL